MALNMRIDDPAAFTNAVLPVVQTWGDLLNAAPGFVGAFDAASLQQAAPVSEWRATYGTGVANQPTAARRPLATTIGGIPVVQNDTLSKNLVLTNTLTTGGTLTVGARFNPSNMAQDFQAIFGGANWRVLHRSAGYLQFDGVTDINFGAGTSNAGWHTVFVTQSATTTTVNLDGLTLTAANSGSPLTSLFILASGNTGTANGYLGGLRKLYVSTSDLTGTQHATNAISWLNS